MNYVKNILLILIILLYCTSIFAADEITYPIRPDSKSKEICTKNICSPDQVKRDDKTLTLRGQELYKYFIFNVYVASFYSEKPIKSLDEFYETSGDKFLRLHYLRSIDADEFISSSKKALKEIPYAKPDSIKDELNQLFSSYEDINEGESYSLYYSDDLSITCLFKNDVRKTCIKGNAFYKAYFSIWLSNYSLDNEFSKKLLKNADVRN